MEQKLRNQSINRLDVNDNILNVLKEKEIDTIEKLCSKSKTDLKNIGLLPNESNKVELELQLMGLNLRNSL